MKGRQLAVAWCSVCDVSLCTACLKAHRRNPASRHHDVSDMSEKVKVTKKRKVTCHEHKEEFVKFYCKECKKILCQSCCILYHRKCESVVSLESMLPEMRTSLEAKKETLTKKVDKEENKVDSLKTECIYLQKTKSSIQSQIRSTAQRAIDTIKKKEKKLTDELNEITDKQMDQLNADIKTGDMAIQIYRQQCEFIDQALNSDSEMDVYYLYQSCESETGESMEDMDRRTRTRIEFTKDVDELEKALTELPLGKIQVIGDRVLHTVSTPVLSYATDCRTKEDKNKPYLFDIKCVEVNGSDHLIISDSNNNCIKSFHKTDGQQLYSRLKLKSDSHQIAKLVNNTIALTLPDSKQIAVVSVTPDLSLISTITTNKAYWGLTALTPTTLAAGSFSPPCVDILDISGNVLQSISPQHNGQKIIQYPGYLCTTRQGNILVSDHGTKSVVCLTPNRKVVFNYSPTGDKALQYPTGIISTATGHILVVDNLGHKVIQLSESGQFVSDILKSQYGISNPYGIDYSEKGRIYVSQWTDDDGDSVKVFTLK